MRHRTILGASALLTAAVVSAIFAAAPAVPAPANPPARGGRGGRGGFTDPNAELINLTLVAQVSTSYVSGDQTITAVNDGLINNPPTHYGNWPRAGTQWVEYRWTQPIFTDKVDVAWYTDGRGLQLPSAARIKYWDGTQYIDVPNAQGLGVSAGVNTTTFDEIKTDRIRLEIDAQRNPLDNQISTGINEFRVFDSGKSPAFPPSVTAGRDRVVVTNGRTFLNATARMLPNARADEASLMWTKEQGPGSANFADASKAVTTATFTVPGDYVLKLTAKVGELGSSDTLRVRVDPASSGERLDPVQTSTYKIDSPFWGPRLKAQIINWIPHVVDLLENPANLPRARGGAPLGPGGIDNFIEAAKKLRGEPAARHLGYPFSNAYVHNTVEAMCTALMFDAQGDAEIVKAQDHLRAKLDQWIPIILAAQEPDGYIQTRFTLNGGTHWDARTRSEHEGYVMGYFIESAIAHFNMTKGQDRRLYDAAKTCADVWVANIGPGKKPWYDGHQAMETGLVRFSRLVDQVEGAGKGKKYVELAKFLLDSRAGGSPYDQSHLPAIQQYEAVGHAVRAAYTYAGMASVAAEFHDLDYESATKSLWDNIINRKIYITGGIGSGETSEGFGPDFSLRNAQAYCESCANCGQLFFGYNMLLNYHHSTYVDAYENTLYNAILGDNNLEATHFEYTNPLVENNRPRALWDNCPCCVGNIPRTLLQLPTWTYSTGKEALYVNLFVGSTMTVPSVAGTRVEMVQKTNYPWDGKVAITVNPAQAKQFALRVRVPDRNQGTLYTATPAVKGLESLSVNGAPLADVRVENGYATISREWRAGDTVEFIIPLQAQRMHADERVAADRGMVALRYGPLVYNIESADNQNLNAILPPTSPLKAEWRPDLLQGVMVIKSTFADGNELTAIPNYARNNRGGRSQVWIQER